MATDDLDSTELFISHASEDKDELVRPLADYLRRTGVKVWYDEFTLTAGDSLSRSIDSGLAKARYGLVVISPHFIRKRWPEYELRGLTAKEVAGVDKVIIPLWHNITSEEILQFSPSLADKLAVVTSGLTTQEIAEAILRAIRPDLARQVSLLRAYQRGKETAHITTTPADQVAVAPIPPTFVAEGHVAVRVLNIVNTIGLAAPETVGDFETFITDLYRDLHPEPELRVWESMAASYLVVIKYFELSPEERAQVVNLLLGCSLRMRSLIDESCSRLPNQVAYYAMERWRQYAEMSNHEAIRFTSKGRESSS